MNITTLKSPYVISKPLFLIRDSERDVKIKHTTISRTESKTISILEQYYNDVYKLLLARLVRFDQASNVLTAESERLESLVHELIKIKSLLVAKK